MTFNLHGAALRYHRNNAETRERIEIQDWHHHQTEEARRMEYPSLEEVSSALMKTIRERVGIAEDLVGLETPDALRRDISALRLRLMSSASMNLAQLRELNERAGAVVEQVAHGRTVQV